MISPQTKKYKRLALLMGFISILLLIAPIGYYTTVAFIAGTVVEKVSLGALATLAVIMVAINALLKLHLRSPLWIMLVGVYLVLDYILPLILIIAITTIADELIFTPLCKKFKNKATINGEIDKRLP